MSTTTKRCDECGRLTANYQRVYRGSRYCGSCYARVLQPRRCSRCNKITRLHVGEPEALCRQCERDVPCVRCGKLSYSIGRITPYGPVCNACSVHFREERPCIRCGKLSRLLSRNLKAGIEEQVCPACQRVDHGTCSRCRRSRQLLDDDHGRKVCKTCLEGGSIPCSQCNKPMPAGRGQRCESCYWAGLAAKRAATASEVFPLREHAEVFRDFARWLCTEVGAQKAAVTLLKYLPFFVEVASLGVKTPPYPELLQYFSTMGLRRNLLPMRFFELTSRVVVDEQQKQDASDQRRIEATLSGAPSASCLRELLHQYHGALRRRLAAGKTSLRSVRLSLTPAAALLTIAAESGRSLPTQDDLLQYLSSTPGQWAAVTGFVNFLSVEHGAPLQMPAKTESRSTFRLRRGLERAIAKQLESDLSEPAARAALLESALRYFHHMPARVAKQAVAGGSLTASTDGSAFVFHAGTSYRLPLEVSRRLLAGPVKSSACS